MARIAMFGQVLTVPDPSSVDEIEGRLPEMTLPHWIPRWDAFHFLQRVASSSRKGIDIDMDGELNPFGDGGG